MRKSYIIEVRGEFAGAAVSQDGAFRFIAVDLRFESLDHSLWPSVTNVQTVVSQTMAIRPPSPGIAGEAR